MKTLVVGDLHGRLEIVEKVLSTDYNIVFVGDYLDSFDRTVKEQTDTLDLVLTAINTWPDKVMGLLGNHELSYLDSRMQCAGHNPAMKVLVEMDYKRRMIDLLKPYIWVGDYLITHAGVSNKLLMLKNQTLQEYLYAGDFFQIDKRRGGSSACGGLYWCDWMNFDPVKGIKQIVGHTNRRAHNQERGIITKGAGHSLSYNVDCLNRVEEFALINEDGTDVEIVKI